MAGLLENGRYPGVFYSRRLASVPRGQFAVPWWYRDAFELHPAAGQHTFLRFRGVLSRADAWVNGTKVASRRTLQGAYSELELDVTGLVRDGANALALEGLPERRGRARRAHAQHGRLEPRRARRQHGPAVRPADRAGRSGLAARRARAAAHRGRSRSLATDREGGDPQQHGRAGDRRAQRLDHARRHADRARPTRAHRGARDGARILRTRRRAAPRALVAVPDGQPTPLPSGPRRRGRRRHERFGGGGLRHPPRDLASDAGAPRDVRRERLSPVRDQRPAVRGAGRRLVAGDVPALLACRHRRPARLREGSRAERDPLRGEPAPRGHVRAAGPGGHPRPARLAVLQPLGAGLGSLDARAARERAQPGRARRNPAARPRERPRVLPGERRGAGSRQGGPLPRGVPSGRLDPAPDRVGRVQALGEARPFGLEGGAVQLGPPGVLVGVRPGDGRGRRLHERRRRVRLRHGGERGRVDSDAATRSTASSRRGISASCGTRARCTGWAPVPRSSTRAPTAATPRSAGWASSTRRCGTATATGRGSPPTSARPRPRATRSPAHSSRPPSGRRTIAPTPARASSTGS